MTLRMPGCRSCEQLSSGDCGMHGPIMIPAGFAGLPEKYQPSNLPAKPLDLHKLIEKWRYQGAMIDTFHATMGVGYKVCADELEAILKSSGGVPMTAITA